jgi:hypothetical protein
MRLCRVATKKPAVEAALRLFIQTLSEASPLDVKEAKSKTSARDRAAIVRKRRERLNSLLKN